MSEPCLNSKNYSAVPVTDTVQTTATATTFDNKFYTNSFQLVFNMLGEKAFELIKDLERSRGTLLPFDVS